MKLDYGHLLLIGVAIIIVLGYSGIIEIPTVNLGDQPLITNQVSVTRPVKFVCTDKYAGASVTSATIKIYDGVSLKESLTTDGTTGIATSGLSYSSGSNLNILLIKGNSKMWYKVEVPSMSPADVEAITTNPVALEFFTVDTSTVIKVVDSLGNSYSTTDSLNFTTLGVNQVTLTVSGYVSADNKGYMSSYDPLNGIRWNGMCFGKLSGTNYEVLSLSGWDTSYPKGTAIWGAERIPDTGLTKYKVGNDYVHPGVFSFSLTLTKGGYTGGAADLDIDLYAYSDPTYHETYGSFGPDAVALASSFQLNILV